MIDVAALDSHNLEQHEYVERARQYIQKTQAAQPVLQSKYNKLALSRNTGKISLNCCVNLVSQLFHINFFINRYPERCTCC